MNPGKLDRRVTLLEPFEARDTDGMVLQEYQSQGEIWANFRHRPGSEAFQQARMEAKSPATVAVRASSLTQRITADWRLESGGMVYDIKGEPYPSDDRSLLIMQVEGRRK